MFINEKIFKQYDIRGVYRQELDEKTAFIFGRAFVVFLKKEKPKIVIGRDNRLSSDSLFENLAKGIIEQGGEIIDIGLSPTPVLYWATGFFEADGGVQITASHNPPEYNGFKLVREKVIPISGESGLEEIKNIIRNLNESPTESRQESDFSARIFKKEIISDYIKFNLEEVDFGEIKPLKIIFDTANSVSGLFAEAIKNIPNSPLKISHLFEELDGSFPNHNPDPSNKENLAVLQKEILAGIADLGVAFDGDGDRIIFLDEKADPVRPDLILVLLAEKILKEKNKSSEPVKILYDIRGSGIVKEKIETDGGIPILSRVGHSFIKEKMRKEDILFGGEFSGHYYHKNHYFAEAPLFVLFEILKILSKENKPFSEIIKSYQKYYHSGEINFEVEDKEKILKNFEEKYKEGKINKLDGLRIDFDDFWFLLRASNTEPKIRLIIEAKTKEVFEQKKEELIKMID